MARDPKLKLGENETDSHTAKASVERVNATSAHLNVDLRWSEPLENFRNHTF
jgi:hypothetical protein